MGCCFSEPVDFDSEVNLFHFELHRAVGKGAFGKVSGRYNRSASVTQSNTHRYSLPLVPGQGSRTQEDKASICTQVHR